MKWRNNKAITERSTNIMEKLSKETLANTVGARLKELRKAMTDLGQKEVADNLGITKQALSNYESGRNLPDHTTLIALAKYYSCTTDYLYGLTNKRVQKATNYSERESVNSLLHAMDAVAEDEGDFVVSTMADTLNALSINKKNPQRRSFIELLGEFFISCTEYIETSTKSSNHLSNPNITSEDVAKEAARFYSYHELTNIAESIQQTGFSAILNFSSDSKKKLRIRKTFGKSLDSNNIEKE